MKEHLTEDDYGGIYYDEKQRIDIFLVNNKWKDLLEKQGFQCIESELIQAYKKADARTQEIVKLSLQPYMPQETKLSDSQIG